MEYEARRSARLFLVRYPLGYGKYAYSYVIAPQGVDIGDTIMSGPEAPVAPGNALPLHRIPPGTEVHNLEQRPGLGGVFAKAAGTKIIVIKHQGNGFS